LSANNWWERSPNNGNTNNFCNVNNNGNANNNNANNSNGVAPGFCDTSKEEVQIGRFLTLQLFAKGSLVPWGNPKTDRR